MWPERPSVCRCSPAQSRRAGLKPRARAPAPRPRPPRSLAPRAEQLATCACGLLLAAARGQRPAAALPAACCPLPAADRGAPSCPLNPPMLPAQAPALPACCCRRSQLPPPLPPPPPLPLPPPHAPRLAVAARSSRIPRRAPSRRAQTCSRAGSSAPSAQGKRRREGRGAEGCREQGHRRTKREFG